jgi:hypothetical protein
MRTLARRLSTAAATIALVSLAFACATEDADEDVAPADTIASSAETTTAEEPVSTGLQPGQSSTYEVAITNPMPHAMVVTVGYTGGGETELGTVPAGGEQSFTVAASAGETITLVATDEAATHSPTTTMTLPEGQTRTAWTIE